MLHAQVVLPIEVIGPDGYIEAVTFTLDDASGVDALYLKAHRLAYRDASTNPDRGAKGSVKLNDGAWVALDNSTVNCYEHEAAYGCLSGAYHTVRLSVPITGAKSGQNTLRFRFNGTDGFSIGYRILEFNVLKGQQKLLTQASFVQDDPATWSAPRPAASDIAAGKVLWETAPLLDGPGLQPISATCSGCHPVDGRDLEYFAFSNWSIQERAKFHGLDQQEAEQIASYIRSLKDSKGIKRLGRPWNPPYQPGPGLDSKPVEYWAAGAGLDWVLKKDRDMVKHTFAGSLTPEMAQAVFDIDQTQNARETPLALQLPDWQEWLPEVHPVDAPRITEEEFYETPAMHNESFYDTYANTRKLLDENPIETLIADGRLKDQMNRLAAQTTNMNNRMKAVFGYSGSVSGNSDTKDGIVSFLMKWGATKSWEIMQEYALEEMAPQLFEHGEPRSWLSSRRNVFEIAPHRSANNDSHFPYQSVLVGKHFSTAWYHLQLIINGGNRETLRLWPVDWNYQPNHISGLHSQGGGPRHPYRYAVSHAKMLQQYHEGKVVTESGIGFRQIHPGRYTPITGRKGTIFELLPDTERALLMEGLLNATMDLIEEHAIDEWPRDTLDRSDNTLRPSDYQPKKVSEAEYGKLLHGGHYADIWYTMIPYFREASVGEATLSRAIDWGRQMWPRGNWDAIQAPDLTFVRPLSDSTLTVGDLLPLTVSVKGPGNQPTEVTIRVIGQDATLTEDSDRLEWSPSVAGSYVVEAYAESQSGIRSEMQILRITVVPANKPPVALFTSPTDNFSPTLGDSVLITANAQDPDGVVTQLAFAANNQTLATVNQANYEFFWQPLETGRQVLTVRAQDDQATFSTTDTLILWVESPVPEDSTGLPSPEPPIAEDSTGLPSLEPPAGLSAKVVAGPAIQLSWSAGDGLAVEYQLERKTANGEYVSLASLALDVTVYQDEDVEEGVFYSYRIRAIGDTGASLYSDEVSVEIEVSPAPQIEEPSLVSNMLTPNGDFRNDTWAISESAPCDVWIFDRSGQLVFQQSNYQNDWTGTARGKMLESGVYYYQVLWPTTQQRVAGFLTLIRP